MSLFAIDSSRPRCHNLALRTIDQIKTQLRNAGKNVRRETIYRYLRQLKITPSGANQRPQMYPPDTATRVLNHLGLTTFAQSNAMDWANGNLTLAQIEEKNRLALADAVPAKLHTLKTLKKKGGK